MDWQRQKGHWRPLLAGVYLVGGSLYPPRWQDLPFATRLSAARLFHGADTIAVLATAATIHGIAGLTFGDGPIHLRRPPGAERHKQPGVRVHTWRLPAAHIATVDSMPVTSVARTLADLARTAGRFEAVSVLDSALNAGLVTEQDLPLIEDCAAGLRGACRARTYLGACNGLAASALETRVRLIASDAGLAPDQLQYPVYDAYGVLLGLGDMAWIRPGRRTLIAEADGKEPHSRPEALFRDRRRANDFVTAGGVDVVRFTWEDTLRPAYIVSILRQNVRPL